MHKGKTKNVIDAISQIHTETEDTLKLLIRKKKRKVNKY